MRNAAIVGCGLFVALGLTTGAAWAQDANAPGGAGGDANVAPVQQERSDGGGATAPGTAGGKAGGPTTSTSQPIPTGRRGGDWLSQYGILIIMLGGFVLLWVWMGRSRRKQEAKRKEMLARLKKGDKVVTIGGIMGTVMDASKDELTVKVDESNNVRMKFARWAVRGVGEEAKSEPEDKK